MKSEEKMSKEEIRRMLELLEDPSGSRREELISLEGCLSVNEHAEVVEAVFKKYPDDKWKRKKVLSTLFEMCYGNSL